MTSKSQNRVQGFQFPVLSIFHKAMKLFLTLGIPWDFFNRSECEVVPKKISEVKQNKVRKTLKKKKIQMLAASQKPQSCGNVICHLSLLVDQRSWQHIHSGSSFFELTVCSNATETAKQRQKHIRDEMKNTPKPTRFSLKTVF